MQFSRSPSLCKKSGNAVSDPFFAHCPEIRFQRPRAPAILRPLQRAATVILWLDAVRCISSRLATLLTLICFCVRLGALSLSGHGLRGPICPVSLGVMTCQCVDAFLWPGQRLGSLAAYLPLVVEGRMYFVQDFPNAPHFSHF